MSVRPSILCAVLIGLAWPRPAQAGPAASPSDAATAVAKAFSSDGASGVAAIADRLGIDPWLVVDALIDAGSRDAAAALAQAGKGPDAVALAAYARSGRPDERNAVARVSAVAASAAGTASSTPAPAPRVADVLSLEEKADALAKAGRSADAVAALEEAARSAAGLGWRRREAACLCAVADASAEDRTVALERWDGAVARADGAGDVAVLARALAGQGVALLRANLPRRAAEVLESCVMKCAVVGDRRAQGRGLLALMDAYAASGDVPAAVDRGGLARECFRAVGDASGVASALAGLGGLDRRLGRFPRALIELTQACQGFEKAGDAAGVARAEAALADVQASLGSYSDAIRAGERALDACRAHGDRDGEAAALVALAGIEGGLARRDEAEAKFRSALALQESRGDRGGVARTLADLGAVLVDRGDPAAAREPLARALSLARASGDRAVEASVLATNGAAALVAGDRADARALFLQALAKQEALGDCLAAPDLLRRLGELDLVEGDRKGAIARLDRAAREARSRHAEGALARALGSLAQARLASGQDRAALDAAREATRVIEGLLSGLAEEQQAIAREPFADVYAAGARAAARADETAETAWFLEAGRAGALLQALDEGSAGRRGAAPEALRAGQDAARAAEARATLDYRAALDAGDRRQVAERGRVLEEARKAAQDAAERAQREVKRSVASVAPRPATLEDLQGQLAASDAMLLYGLVGPDAIALVVRRDEARVVPLGPAADVVAACEALHADDATADPAPARRRLAALVLEPLKLPRDAKRLLVSPDGPLSYVPWSLLDDHRDLAYLPSGTTLTLLAETVREPGRGVLALGDPDYAAPAAGQALAMRGGLRLVRLPASGIEAAAVGDVTLLGVKATEAGLASAIAAHPGRWRAVHFACHGLIDPERPSFCALALSPGEGGDGFLTALDVAGSEIPADLVVLSACETGRGRVVRGEGILGLARAFMSAGAPRVLASLWKVDDEATQALMTAFYAKWKAGVPAARALREAQDTVRSQPKWSHPSYWAAWVLWGLPD